MTIARIELIKRSTYYWLITILVAVNLSMPLATKANQRTKLIVYLIADQFSCSYFSNCLDKFPANGFRELLDNGADFTACRYAAATNQTASNLAVIATGAYPWSTGIVGNEWYDRRKQKIVRASLGDDNAEEVGSAAAPAHGTTIGDELKITSNGLSRVISISSLESNALLLSGKSRDGVFWWNNRSGNFTGLSRSGTALPPWVQTFNQKHYSEKFLGKNWRSKSNAPASNNAVADEGFYTQFIATPWANQMLVDLAKETIQQESLGQRDSTDVINIDFPSFELIGRNYGPYSPEAYDLVVKFDRSIADLLQFLDSKVGLTNCLIVFTASHGAMAGQSSGKMQETEGGIVEASLFQNQLNASLSAKLGKANWLEAFAPPNVYLNLSAIDHSSYKQPDIEKLAAKLSRAVPGVGEIYTAFQFFMNQVPIGPQVEAVQKSYYWGRSGELYITPKPGFAFVSESSGTVCGSPYNYDAQVPLIIYGNSIKSGIFANASSPADIAPTIANMLGINCPSLAEGRVLAEALNWTPRAKYVKPNR